MMDVETMQAFRKEAAKAPSGSGKALKAMGGKALRATGGFIKDTGQAVIDSFNPKTIARGAKTLTNIHPEKEKALAENILKKNKALREAGRGGKYVSETEKGLKGALRRYGVLSNAPVYKGEDKFRKARNVVTRHLPGEAATEVAMTGGGAAMDLMPRKDEEGKKVGLGERAGGALMNVTGSLAGRRMDPGKGMLRNLAVGTIAGQITGTVGRKAGRFVDKGIAKARGKQPLKATGQAAGTAAKATAASPPATGVA